MNATGGDITEVGGYRYHVYILTTTDKTFVPDVSGDVEVIDLAGGGGGAWAAGGGGAGGLLHELAHAVTVTSYDITVGDGGNGSTSGPAEGSNGQNSIFDSMTALGGGGGGHFSGGGGYGNNGGCGGGMGTYTFSGTPGQGSQGFNGGSPGNGFNPCGGGGLGEDGHNNITSNGGDGIDSYSDILQAVGLGVLIGSTYWIGGGGSGGRYTAGDGIGGKGGGGNGGQPPSNPGSNGTANTGGGGAGGDAWAGGNGGKGGSGFVIVRYPIGGAPVIGPFPTHFRS